MSADAAPSGDPARARAITDEPSLAEAVAILEMLATSISQGDAALLVQEAAAVFLNPETGPEARLRLAEARYRALVEQLPAVTFLASLVGGTNEIYVSPQIETLLGFTQEEWLSNPVLWFRQLHPGDRAQLSRDFAEVCAKGQPFRGVYRVIARNGTLRWVLGEARFVRDDAGRPLFLQGIAFDITEQQQAQDTKERLLEERLARAEADRERTRLRDLFMGLPAATAVLRGPEHRIELLNPIALEIAGLTADAVGKPLAAVLPELEPALAVLDRVLSTGEPYVAEEQPVRRERWERERTFNFACQPLRDAEGAATGILIHLVEVTEQVEARRALETAHEALKAAEERQRLAVEAAAFGTWSVDPVTLALTCDERCKAILRLPHGEGLSHEAFLLALHPMDRAPARAAIALALDPAGGGQLELEARLAASEAGDERWVVMHGRAAFDGAGRTLRLLGIARDATDARRAAAERERLIDQLQRTLRFSEMFVGMLGHDLRNPLGAITTAARLIERRAPAETIARPTARIITSAERMARMIDQLLDFTRIRLGRGLQLRLEVTDALALCRTASDELAGPDREIRVEGVGDCTGRWDADRLLQLLSNLIANALEHRTPGTPVQVLADGRSPEVVVIEVNNAGAVDPAVLPVMFEPFRGTETKRASRSSGLGLGLFISHQIASAHQGRLVVTSDEVRGTTMRTELPRGASTSGVEQAFETKVRGA